MTSLPAPVREFAEFARTWLRSPRRMGAIAPSGPDLARVITAGISRSTGPVLELGPGTGVFTRALVARGVPEENLTLLERDPRFARRLRTQFPGARVISGCATALEDHLETPGPASGSGFGFGAVVSGLPLLSLPPADVRRIITGAFTHLDAGRPFYQFTYRPLCPVPAEVLRELRLEARLTGFSLRNLPPAWVFALRRRAGRG
ncbi:MAG: phospholipid methyltransferase [Verrucomicrobiaceae bacterium]|nr:MAG: phospholipid methyltransferase [Verrucomicrobiaceae bacterium]